ncbi:MAG: fatty acid desaturase [Leptolyngbyaceae bacterium]|nr:fatty acid desaturase [Leptolyngbyaceae bacterium]
MTVATRPLAAAKATTVPRELLGPGEDFLNPTLLVFLGALAVFIANTVFYFKYGWGGWIPFYLNAMVVHIAGTVIHDASHKSAHRNKLVNAAMGHGSALLLGFSYPVFLRVHLQHHAHVNDPKNDPDHFVSTGGPLWMIPARFFYHEVFFFKRRLWRQYDLLGWLFDRLAFGFLIYLAVQFGGLDYFFDYWAFPALLAGFVSGLFFDYFPHRPFKERDRWKNARVYPNQILNLLIMGQNYHLVHHLWPSIPWYRYQTAYYATQPLLTEKGCHQTLGISTFSDIMGLLYDAVLGIRFGHHADDQSDQAQK